MSLQPRNQSLIILAAGGTGGHIFPAEALARKLTERGHRLALLTDTRTHAYNGVLGSLDTHFVYSRYSWSLSFLSNLMESGLTLSRIFRAYRIIKMLAPKLVIGFGGYPSFPTVLAARLNRVKAIIHEQNAVIGRANKLLAPFSDLVATSFLETQGLSKDVDKVIHTGNPVRLEMNEFRKSRYKAPSNSEIINILVIGGSQGANFLDNTIPEVFSKMPEALISRIQLTQQCRPENLSKIRLQVSKYPIDAKVESFFLNIGALMAEAHLVIARAGASTLSEIAVIGRPALLIPYPHATNNHQYENALQFSLEGGAEIVKEENCNVNKLATKITELLLNKQKLEIMAQASRNSGRPNASNSLADIAESIVSKNQDNDLIKSHFKRDNK